MPLSKYKKLADLESDLTAGTPVQDIITRVRLTDNDDTRVWIANVLEQSESKELKEAYEAATHFNVVYSRIQARARDILLNPFAKKISPEEKENFKNDFTNAVAQVMEKFKAIPITPQHKDFLLKISYLYQGMYLRAIDNDQDHSKFAEKVKAALIDLLGKNREQIWLDFDTLAKDIQNKVFAPAISEEKEQKNQIVTAESATNLVYTLQDAIAKNEVPPFNESLANLLRLNEYEKSNWKSLHESYLSAPDVAPEKKGPPKRDRSITRAPGILQYLANSLNMLTDRPIYLDQPDVRPPMIKEEYAGIFARLISNKTTFALDQITHLENIIRTLNQTANTFSKSKNTIENEVGRIIKKHLAEFDFNDPVKSIEKIQTEFSTLTTTISSIPGSKASLDLINNAMAQFESYLPPKPVSMDPSEHKRPGMGR